ncbi:MAG: NAD-dependent protein deacylase [Clostridia bacterium]|nr:NAD-dependent protein deacylase [Clostridia bacterium]
MAAEPIKKLADMLRASKRAVFFGGAGVSTESGIPDFRSTDGLYNQQWRYPPETILSHTFFQRKTEEFYQFYRQKMLFPSARPNPAHEALARLEQMGILAAVITQNIDGLHQAAGSRNVIELHGSVLRNHCVRCRRAYSLDDILNAQGVPRCACGGVIKPDVVLYEEALPPDAIESAVDAIARADLMIIGGTSLAVYPAAGFAADYAGPLAIINRSPTSMDHRADVVIDQPIGQTMKAVMALIEEK